MVTRVPEHVRPDRDDVRLIRALQLAPRASFAALASAVGNPEAATARRYRRLTASGVLRVTGVLDVAALGRSTWWVRLASRPDAARAVANGIATRGDVEWIALTGVGDVSCRVGSREHEQRDELLSVRLPRTRAVHRIETAMVLHRFAPDRDATANLLDDVLTPDEASALSTRTRVAPATTSPDGDVVLEEGDEALLAGLAADGRAGLVELAGAARSTPGRVSRRLRTLVERGAVRIAVEVSAAALGVRAPAVVRLRVAPGRVPEVGAALARLPEAASVDAVTGAASLHAVLLCRDLDHLYASLTERVGVLPGVDGIETLPVLEPVKQGGIRVRSGLLAPP